MAIIPIDSYDKLFAQCNGTGTSFVDSSTANPKTITANGNATQLPILFTGKQAAGFFNGTTDYAVVPDSADWDFGTGDFTFELFFNTSSVAADLMFLDRNSGSDFRFFWDQSEGKYGCTLEGTAYLSSASTPTVNTWTHVAVTRTSGTLAFFVDAVAKGTADASGDNIAGTADVYIGATSTPNTYFSGWMKELRISKVARTVSVPTSEYTSDANTVLLMHFDTTSTSPIGPAIAFDGTGDYLSVADLAVWYFGTGDFTWEGFFQATASLGGGQYLIFNRNSTNNTGFYTSNAGWDIYLMGSSVGSGSYTLVASKWYHFAVSRNGTNLRFFLDGVQQGATITNSTSIASDSAYRIGGEELTGTGITGYMREVRISNSARYTTAFTPSQSGFTVDANTKLYIKGNENNGVTTFVDSETSPKTVTTNGGTKIKYTEDYRSCIFKDETGKFPYPVGSAKVDWFAIGAGVGYFDGTGDYLELADSDDWDMDGEFTLESYVRFASAINGDIITRGTAVAKLGLYVRSNDGGTWYGTFESTAISAISVAQANRWYHFAFVRSGADALKLFLDGTLIASGTKSGAGDIGTVLRIAGTTDLHNGLLDEIRISKGVARYTATFNPGNDEPTPPTPTNRKSQFFMFF